MKTTDKNKDWHILGVVGFGAPALLTGVVGGTILSLAPPILIHPQVVIPPPDWLIDLHIAGWVLTAIAIGCLFGTGYCWHKLLQGTPTTTHGI